MGVDTKLQTQGAGTVDAGSAAAAAKVGALAPRIERVSAEQMAYAGLLDIGMKLGLAMLVVSFSLYVLGAVEPQVPLTELPRYWSMPVGQYLEATGAGTGWSWTRLAGKGDFMNFIGIAFLSGVTILCYLRILPGALRSRDLVLGSILAIETVVLLLAASGILVVGH